MVGGTMRHHVGIIEKYPHGGNMAQVLEIIKKSIISSKRNLGDHTHGLLLRLLTIVDHAT
jgi:hypothetical protein